MYVGSSSVESASPSPSKSHAYVSVSPVSGSVAVTEKATCSGAKPIDGLAAAASITGARFSGSGSSQPVDPSSEKYSNRAVPPPLFTPSVKRPNAGSTIAFGDRRRRSTSRSSPSNEYSPL